MPETTSPTRRRWFRFGLRTLLVMVTLICVWLGWETNAIKTRKAELGSIHRSGNDYRLAPSRTLPWHRRMLGDIFVDEIHLIQVPSESEERRLKLRFPEATVVHVVFPLHPM